MTTTANISAKILTYEDQTYNRKQGPERRAYIRLGDHHMCRIIIHIDQHFDFQGEAHIYVWNGKWEKGRKLPPSFLEAPVYYRSSYPELV